MFSIDADRVRVELQISDGNCLPASKNVGSFEKGISST